jgi:5-methylcytosine-specific restriction protein A
MRSMQSHRARPAPPFDARHFSDWRGPNGRRACRQCGEEVPKGSRAWCSAACVEARTANDFAVLRDRVAERDRGVCANCGTDTIQLREWVREAMRRALHDTHGDRASVNHHAHFAEAQAARAALLPVDRWPAIDRAWWEADHVVPLCEGGAHTIDNLRTLCVPCHKAETAALAARRAQRRQA